ncbi:ribosomal protein L24, putative [Ixodes scapularis]|uniref:Large ribosomal subunit protein uL24m n=1 Tax=Ixodes scapularis TaxID=6945 RepID=B7PHM8_IXOSC|nr:ribosomal protein L24, putative [Ixodes scapularis]|eukprot:XP_002403268.1 ribosomal protein L24, putative [Ixodes scapularis]
MRLTNVLRCASRLPKDYANLPESYVKRSMAMVEWRTPNAPQYQRKVIQRTRFHYNMSRPWTDGFKSVNMPGIRRRRIYVEPIDWTVFRGDRVEVLVGRDKGKQGIVNYIVKERNWVVVEGLNCVRGSHRVSERREFSVPSEIKNRPCNLWSTLPVASQSENKPTKVEWRYTEEGKKVRVSVRTGRILPIPLMAEETMDYKSKQTYFEQPKDTKAKDLEKITYVPKLMTFAQDIMEEMGIKEDRIPAKTYWY